MSNLVTLAKEIQKAYLENTKSPETKKAFHAEAIRELQKVADALGITAEIISKPQGDALLGQVDMTSKSLTLKVTFAYSTILVMYGVRAYTNHMTLLDLCDTPTAVALLRKFV